MPYRQLGKAGVQVSVIGLRTNRFGTDAVPQQDVHTIMDAAEDLGITRRVLKIKIARFEIPYPERTGAP